MFFASSAGPQGRGGGGGNGAARGPTRLREKQYCFHR